LKEYEKKLKFMEIPYQIIPFKGKHEMNKPVLLKIQEKIKAKAL